MLKSENSHAQEAAANTIKALAFSAVLRPKLQEEGDCVRVLESLGQSTDSRVSDAAKGALWVITHG